MITQRRPGVPATPNSPLEFFKGFLRNPKEVGSVIPSSRFLTKRVMDCGEVRQARVIIELGPGTGVLTKQMLEVMRPDAKLIAVELLPYFCDHLHETIVDPRLHIYNGCATSLEGALASAGETQADLIVSGIPFSTIGRGDADRTLEAAKRALSPQGRFVAYQFRSAVSRIAAPVFGEPETHSGFWNIPPMRIYVWPRQSCPI